MLRHLADKYQRPYYERAAFASLALAQQEYPDQALFLVLGQQPREYQFYRARQARGAGRLLLYDGGEVHESDPRLQGVVGYRLRHWRDFLPDMPPVVASYGQLSGRSRHRVYTPVVEVDGRRYALDWRLSPQEHRQLTHQLTLSLPPPP